MRLLLLSAAFAFSVGATIAQEKIDIQVREGSQSIGGGSNNTLTVTIFEASRSDIEKAWKKEMKRFKGKVQMKKEIFADDCSFKNWTNSCDIYAIVNETGDTKREVVVGVDLGGAYLSSGQHSGQYKEFHDFLYGFAVNTTKEAIAGQVKAAETVLAKLEKEQADLKKQNAKLDQLIEDCTAKIEQAEKDIEQNLEDQLDKKGEVLKQAVVVEAVKEKEKAVK